ncbi:MAG TPA: phosphoribosylaminoimidazolesuccinocarboxamide synthase [Candidatus Brocadiia bacterium]|nr:phosphoribosylaminoimidazolesuccinocarboxamide synthase [Candidatus Brocadiia bacterium]
MSNAVFQTNLEGLTLRNRGKVRDVYDLGDKLLIITTDRISCFDSVLPTPIPSKGAVLTALSRFWFDFLKSEVKSHIITFDVNKMPEEVQRHADVLAGRSMLVKKLNIIPVECVVRGYLSGSGWAGYQKDGKVCGIKLPAGLVESDKLPEPIFTPSTKAESGHDENISFELMKEILGAELSERIHDISINIYKKASEYVRSRGIIIADTKFEFGRNGKGEIVLADEVLTPDSSRFWPADGYKPGGGQPSFDKQYVRDWLVQTAKWNKEPPAPPLPEDVVARTTANYRQAYSIITGKIIE